MHQFGPNYVHSYSGRAILTISRYSASTKYLLSTSRKYDVGVTWITHTRKYPFHSELYHDLIEGSINLPISPMTESLFDPLIESHSPHPPDRWEWIDTQPDMTSTRSLARITTTSKILLKACMPTYSTVGIVHIFHRKQLRRRRSINWTFAYPEH